MRYQVAAVFGRPVAGEIARAAADTEAERVYADTPESAARKWLWKLSAEERAATERLVISAPAVGYKAYEVYRGPSIEFIRVGGRLEALDSCEYP